MFAATFAIMKDFRNWILASSAAMRFVMIPAFMAMVYFVLQKMHHREAVVEWEVYRQAAEALFAHKQVYGFSFNGSNGYFTFSPFVAFFFGLIQFIPATISSGVYYFSLLFVYIFFSLFLVYSLEKRLALSGQHRGWILTLITAFLLDHFERELHIGNLNVLVLAFIFLLFLWLEKGDIKKSGILLGILFLVKPALLFLLPLLIWQKKLNVIGIATGVVAIGFLLPMLVLGWSCNFDLWSQWINYAVGPTSLIAKSGNTVYGMYYQFVLAPFDLISNRVTIFMWVAISMVSMLFWWVIQSRRPETIEGFWLRFFTVIAFIPHFVPTDTDHFMWTWPLLAYTFTVLFYYPIERKWLFGVMLGLAFFPYCLNSPDIIGNKLAITLDAGGYLGLSNLLLVFVALSLAKAKRTLKLAA